MPNAQLDVLQQQQRAFAASIRQPFKQPAIAGVAAERMAVYRDLFFNNIKETLASAFPVLFRVLPSVHWQAMCEQFFAEHRCHTPYLSHVPFEFVEWLQKNAKDYPVWLLELAQWEAIELELILAPDSGCTESTGSDVLQDVPQLSSLVRVFTCSYAVHQISENYFPENPSEQPVYLLAWRKQDDRIGFMQINLLCACLLEKVQGNTHQNGQALLVQVAEAFPEIDPALIIQGGNDALVSFHQQSIIYFTAHKG